MIKLTFTEFYQAPVSPLILTFEGSALAPPVFPPQVGVYNALQWADIAAKFNMFMLGWQPTTLLQKLETMPWFYISYGQYNALAYSNFGLKLLKTNTELSYIEPTLININITLSYGENFLQQSSVDMTWQNTMVLFATETIINFNQCTVLNIDKKVVWQEPQLIKNNTKLTWHSDAVVTPSFLKINYGVKPYDIECTWEQHPKDGLVILSLNTNATVNNSPISMSLNKDGQTCVLVRNEGFIRAFDEHPVVDRNIPIEPQIQSSYIMEPSVVCIRVSDNLEILISSFDYQISRSQFAATASIKFSSRIDYERSINELLKVTLNGYEFFVLVEQGSKNEVFASAVYTASCRSRLAELSPPYLRAVNFTNLNQRSFMGLITDILQNTGWTAISNIIDFVVPAKAFSFQNKTPAEALKMCVDAIGAMLLVDDASKTVTITPKWPVMPWTTDTATCDVIINDSLILSHNKSDIISPLYDVVMVRGEQDGVQVKVKLNSTLADSYAPDVTNSLISDVQAARQRGSCEIANSGNQTQSVIRTKIRPDLPPIKPGMLLGISYGQSVYKATCDSATYSAKTDRKGKISVNQTITLLKRVA